MKIFAIIGAFGLVATVLTTNVPQSMQNPMSEHQTLSIPEYETSFERGTYLITEHSYGKNSVLSEEELTRILKQAGFSGRELKMAKAIVFYESTNRPMAHNKNSSTGDDSYGLFQINMRGNMGPDRRERYGLESNDDLFSPLINATVAYKMSSGGKDWSAWSTEKIARSSIN